MFFASLSRPATMTSRMNHQTQFGMRSQHAAARIRRAVVGWAVGALVLLAACSGSDNATPSGSRPVIPTTTGVASATTAAAAPATSAASLRVTATSVVAPGEGVTVPAGLEKNITDVVQRYVAGAVTRPLTSGQPAALDDVLTSSALRSLTAPQRAALTDEGRPRLTGFSVNRFDLGITALAGQDGVVGAVDVSLDLAVSGTGPDGAALSIERKGDLSLVPEGFAWRIDAFELSVTIGGRP